MRLSLKIKKRFQIFFRYVHGPITVLQKQSKQSFIKQLTNLERSACSGKSQFLPCRIDRAIVRSIRRGLSSDFGWYVFSKIQSNCVLLNQWGYRVKKKVLFMGKIKYIRLQAPSVFKPKDNIIVQWLKVGFVAEAEKNRFLKNTAKEETPSYLLTTKKWIFNSGKSWNDCANNLCLSILSSYGEINT